MRGVALAIARRVGGRATSRSWQRPAAAFSRRADGNHSSPPPPPPPASDFRDEDNESDWSWGWSPPAHSPGGSADVAVGYQDDAHEIPVILHKELTLDEVEAAMDALGAVDIGFVPVEDGRLGSIEHMVIATGRTTPHLRKLALVLVTALKRRKLTNAPGITGADGYDDTDGWMVVDCGNMMVHVVTQAARDHLALEELWRSPEATTPQAGKDEDEELDRLAAAFPVRGDGVFEGQGGDGGAASRDAGPLRQAWGLRANRGARRASDESAV